MIKYMYFDSKKNSIQKGDSDDYGIPKNNDFVWLFMQSSQEAEIKKVCKDFSVDGKYFRTFSKENRSTRYSIDPLIFVFMDYYLENGRIKSSRNLFILKENALIIVMQQRSVFYSDLFDKLVSSFETTKTKSLVRLMYQFLLEDVEENYDVVERVETIIMELEKDVTSGKNGKRIHDIIKFKRMIYRMSRRFWGSAKIVYLIKRGLTPLKVDVESIILLDDVYNTYMQQIDILSSAKEMLSDILAVYEIRVQNDLNIVIKKLTAITVILMVPSLIASVYGMNFRFMPEIGSPLGYPLAVLSMVFSSVILYYFFHKKKWF
jgi:magnesium transporter